MFVYVHLCDFPHVCCKKDEKLKTGVSAQRHVFSGLLPCQSWSCTDHCQTHSPAQRAQLAPPLPWRSPCLREGEFGGWRKWGHGTGHKADCILGWWILWWKGSVQKDIKKGVRDLKTYQANKIWKIIFFKNCMCNCIAERNGNKLVQNSLCGQITGNLKKIQKLKHNYFSLLLLQLVKLIRHRQCTV